MAPKKSRSRALAILLLCSAGCDQGGAKLPLETPFEGTIQGVVSSEAGNLPGVTVRLSGAVVREARTSSGGSFSFPGLPAGGYTVTISGYPEDIQFPTPTRPASLREGIASVRIDFFGTIRKDASIRGMVAVEGSGLEGISVSLSGPEPRSFTTDSLGQFTFSQLKRGSYTVSISGFDPSLYAFPTTTESVHATGGPPVEAKFTGSLIPQAPKAPQGLSVLATGSATMALNWDDESEDETRTEVERKQGSVESWRTVGSLDPDVTAFQDVGLTPVTTYSYRVRACNEVGCSEFSNEGSATTHDIPPAAPTALTATKTGAYGIDLAWSDGSVNEAAFEVERKVGTEGDWAQLETQGADITTARDSGLQPNTSYTYRVRACNDMGCSVFSNEAKATTDEVPPSAPSQLVASPTGPTTAWLGWVDGSDNETRFDLERRLGSDGAWKIIAEVGPDMTSYGDVGLTPKTTYRYRIRACNEVGCSPFSAEAAARTDEIPPAPPSGLGATTAGSSSITLGWTDRSGNETHFLVDRKVGAGGGWALLTSLDANQTTWVDSGLTPVTTYYYRIQACNDAGCSSYTDEAGATTAGLPPTSPGDLAASATGTTTIDLSWNDPSSTETGFRVERKEGAAGTYAAVGSVPANSTAFSDTDLTANTEYFYRVFAYNASGDSPPSNESSVTTLAESGSNLSIANLYLTQSTQTLSGDVPLVADKDGYLRVFAVASEPNSFQTAVRVRFYHGGSLIHTDVIPAPGASVPTGVLESPLTSSWNVFVPASLIQPGLTVLADVDPSDQVTEGNEADNHYPQDGSPMAMDVRTTSDFEVTFVPVRQSANGLVGDVTAANAAQYLKVTLKMLPIAQADVTVHAEFVSTAPVLESGNGNGAWGTILSEVNTLRVAEGTPRYYYGVVKTNYGGGVAGMGFLGQPTAIGWDRLPSGSGIAAHEWGHNWNLRHAPGCGADSPDPAFPNADGKIGAWGLDVTSTAVKSPSTYYDFMTYCGPEWVSDHFYKKILDFRQTFGSLGTPELAEPTLLVWGRVENGRIVLEPAFEITATPTLPSGRGPFRVEGLDRTGRTLYSEAFEVIEVPDAEGVEGHFAFAIPLNLLDRTELSRLTVSGGGMIQGSIESRIRPQMAAAPEPEVGLVGGSSVEITWDATSYPMALVRNPSNGEILSFARGGHITLPSSSNEIEIIFTDGLRNSGRIRHRVR